MIEIQRLINIERQDRIIHLVTRSSSGVKKTWHVMDYYPSMFVKSSVEIPDKYKHRVHKRLKGKWKMFADGSPADKVYTKLPDDVPLIRQAVGDDNCGESDVIYTTKFLTELKMRSGYFVLAKPGTISNSNRAKGEISYKEIIPYEGNIHIPIREIELDAEWVDNEVVLIGFWDNFTNTFYSIGWHKSLFTSENGQIKCLDGKELMRQVFIVPHPRDMLNITFNLIKKLNPDVLAGWNISGGTSDMPMIFKDAKIYGVDVRTLSPFGSAPAPEKIKGLTIFDMYNGYLRITSKQLRSYKLVNVMKTEYKKTIAHDPLNIPTMWKKDPKLLVDYNTTHVDACRFISNKIDVLEFIYQIVYTCCCRFDDAGMSSRLIDALLLSVKNPYVVLPNKPRGYTKEKEAQGAIVVEPKPGRVGEWDLIIDASRLYPSIFLEFNLGTDTLDPNGDIKIKVYNPDGSLREIVKFNSKKKSEIAQAFLFLFDLRNKYEKQLAESKNDAEKKVLKQKIFAVKVVTNAIYGLVGNPGFRLYKQIVQECVTQIARDVITWMQKRTKDEELREAVNSLLKVIYGDTDSIHLKLKAKTLEEAVEKGKYIMTYINKSFAEFVKLYGVKDNKYLKVKLEGVADSAFYKAKKRYAMQIVWDGEILEKPEYKIVGLEPRRSDNPELTGKVTTTVLMKILKKKSKKNIRKYVKKVIRKMDAGEYSPFDLAIPKAVKKPLREYFNGKCRISRKDGTGCGYIEKGKLPFTEKKEYERNRPEFCPECGKKLVYTKPIHAYAADYSNKYLGTNFKAGEKVRYLYVKSTGELPESHVIAIDEDTKIPKSVIINSDMQKNKVILEKVEPLLEAVNITLGIKKESDKHSKKKSKKSRQKEETVKTKSVMRVLSDKEKHLLLVQFDKIANGKQTTLS